MSIIVHCNYYLKQDSELQKQAQIMREETIKEEGCIDYRFVKDFLEEDHYMMIEKWKSKEDLDEHLKKPYLKVFSEYINSISLKPFTFELFNVTN